MIGLGVVGLGRGFMLTLPALQGMPGIRLTAAFDVRSDPCQQFAATFAGTAHDSLEGLLADPAVDAVYIASPHEHHAEQTVAAARAGKHILVEKPMATTLADCRLMIEAAMAAKVVLVIGPSHGFDAPVRTAAAMVAGGAYGALRMMTTFNFTDFMYRPRRPEELDPRQGGGVVYSQAAHQFDVVRRIAGQPVSEITALAGNWDPLRSGDGAYTALVKFGADVAATLTYSGYAHYDSDELLGWVSELGRAKDPAAYGEARRKLIRLSPGEEAEAKRVRTFGAAGASKPEPLPAYNEHFGFALISCERADLKVVPEGIWVFADERKEFVAVPAPRLPRAAAIAEFIAAIDGQPATQDGRWGLATMMCCEALIHSSAARRTVRIAELEPPAEATQEHVRDP